MKLIREIFLFKGMNANDGALHFFALVANPQQSDVNMSNPLDGVISIDEGLEDIIETVVVLLWVDGLPPQIEMIIKPRVKAYLTLSFLSSPNRCNSFPSNTASLTPCFMSSSAFRLRALNFLGSSSKITRGSSADASGTLSSMLVIRYWDFADWLPREWPFMNVRGKRG